MFDKYYKDYWEMLTKGSSPYKYFIDINWRSKKMLKIQKLVKFGKNI